MTTNTIQLFFHVPPMGAQLTVVWEGPRNTLLGSVVGKGWRDTLSEHVVGTCL